CETRAVQEINDRPLPQQRQVGYRLFQRNKRLSKPLSARCNGPSKLRSLRLELIPRIYPTGYGNPNPRKVKRIQYAVESSSLVAWHFEAARRRAGKEERQLLRISLHFHNRIDRPRHLRL